MTDGPPRRPHIAIERRIALAIIRAAGKGHDPLRVGPLYFDVGQDTHAAIVQRLEGVGMEMALDCAADIAFQLEGELDGPDGSRRPRPMPLDPAFVHMLAHAGLDPVVVCWLVVAGGTLDVDDLRSGYRLAHVTGLAADDPQNGTEILCADTVVWQQRGRIFSPALPDTVAGIIDGRPLREVLSHPVLDPLPIAIVRADQRETVTHIHTDHAPVAASVEELVAAMPRT